MLKRILLSILVLSGISHGTAAEKLSLGTGPSLTRADIYTIAAVGDPSGTLILCPGQNGNGEEMVDDPQWNAFAAKENLNLVGLSFASNDDSRDQGYFKAETGSGEILLDGLKRAFGSKQAPLLFFGFSRGAQFTYSFVRWKPDLVASWCAYSATEWESPEANRSEPRGIIACGDEDEPNYSSSVFQFIKGRSLAEPWTWISLAGTGHCRSAALEDFVRDYFTAVLNKPEAAGVWLDVDTKTPTTVPDLRDHPTLAAWLPDDQVAVLWKRLHQP